MHRCASQKCKCARAEMRLLGRIKGTGAEEARSSEPRQAEDEAVGEANFEIAQPVPEMP